MTWDQLFHCFTLFEVESLRWDGQRVVVTRCAPVPETMPLPDPGPRLPSQRQREMQELCVLAMHPQPCSTCVVED